MQLGFSSIFISIGSMLLIYLLLFFLRQRRIETSLAINKAPTEERGNLKKTKSLEKPKIGCMIQTHHLVVETISNLPQFFFFFFLVLYRWLDLVKVHST